MDNPKEKQQLEFDEETQKKLLKESLKRIRDTLLVLDPWKRDSLSSQFYYKLPIF